MSYFKSTTVKPTVKILEVTTPKMIISSTALTKMKLYVDKCTNEVGWLGTAYKVDKNKQTYYMIDDVFLFDQETHATTTEITPEGLSQFAEELLNQKDGMEIWNNMKVWGHSHVKMGTTPSGQDDHQMDTFAKNGHDWSIRIIANQHGSMRVDLYQYEIGVIYSDMPWERAYSQEELEIARQIEALQKQLSFLTDEKEKTLDLYISEEIKVKVRPKSYTNTYYNSNKINPHQVPLNDDYYDYSYGYKAQRTPANVKKNENVVSITEEKKTKQADVATVEDSLIDDYFMLELNYCKCYQDAYELFVSNGLDELYSPNQIVEIWNKALSSKDTIESKFYNRGW